MNSSNRKNMILSGVAITLLVALIIGATYAYFAAQTGNPASADIRINANTVDTLTFASGDPISFSINQENFAEGTGNQTGSTYASAILTANNKTNTATEHYYLYLNIENNTFNYSINSDTPEIIMTITDNVGNEVTDLVGLTYVTATGADGNQVKGYDITNKNGLFILFRDREITTTSTKEERWNVKVTFINYNENQAANAGKSMSAKLIIRKNEFNYNISKACSNGEKLSDCIISLSEKDIAGATKVYHHDANLAYGAGDNSYRFAGGGHSDYYVCKYDGNDVMNTNGEKTLPEVDCSNIYKVTYGAEIQYADNSYSTVFINKKTVNWDSTNSKCVTSSGDDVKSYESGTVTQDACTGTAYYVTIYGGYWLGIEEVGAGEEVLVGYAESEVNNFVCFGSNEALCPTDNLYRIIGVIDGKVKLIKYDYATSSLLGTDGEYAKYGGEYSKYYKGNLTTMDWYYWNNDSNTWSTSLLNKTNLNTNFINNMENEWIKKIATTIWKVGGNSYQKIKLAIPTIAYQNEIVSPDPTSTSTTGETVYTAKIGLMYASDYGFAAGPSAWTTTLWDYGENDESGKLIRYENWMFMGYREWTITRRNDKYSVALVERDGKFNDTGYGNSCAVRPVFFLESSVAYASGDGTLENPIRLGD